MPTGSGETVAETLNWKKPICVNPCDSVPNECKAISSCPPPPPKLMLGPCAPQPCPPCERPLPPITMALVDPCDTRCAHSATGCPSGKQRQLQQ